MSLIHTCELNDANPLDCLERIYDQRGLLPLIDPEPTRK